MQKITNEAPAGIRAGLERIYKADPVNDTKFFDGCSKENEFKAMVLSVRKGNRVNMFLLSVVLTALYQI
jgi:hypothetical protein